MQTVYGLPYGAGLALTTAKYYTPSGRLIQRDYTSFFDYYAHGDDVERDGEESHRHARDAEPATSVFTPISAARSTAAAASLPTCWRGRPSSPEFIQFLLARNAFFDFGVDYLRESPVNTKSWQPDDAVFEKLGTWLKQESIGTPEEIDEAFADAGDAHVRAVRDPDRGHDRRLRRDRGSSRPQPDRQ